MCFPTLCEIESWWEAATSTGVSAGCSVMTGGERWGGGREAQEGTNEWEAACRLQAWKSGNYQFK